MKGRFRVQTEHVRDLCTARIPSHRAQLLDATRSRPLQWRGRAVQSVQLLAEAGLKLKVEVLTDAGLDLDERDTLT